MWPYKIQETSSVVSWSLDRLGFQVHPAVGEDVSGLHPLLEGVWDLLHLVTESIYPEGFIQKHRILWSNEIYSSCPKIRQETTGHSVSCDLSHDSQDSLRWLVHDPPGKSDRVTPQPHGRTLASVSQIHSPSSVVLTGPKNFWLTGYWLVQMYWTHNLS